MRNAELTRRARSMRKGMTKPETRLWLELRRSREAGQGDGQARDHPREMCGRGDKDIATVAEKLGVEI